MAKDVEAIVNDCMDIRNRINEVLSGQDVLTVAICAQMLKRTLQEFTPGAWEQAGEILEHFNKENDEAAH